MEKTSCPLVSLTAISHNIKKIKIKNYDNNPQKLVTGLSKEFPESQSLPEMDSSDLSQEKEEVVPPGRQEKVWKIYKPLPWKVHYTCSAQVHYVSFCKNLYY